MRTLSTENRRRFAVLAVALLSAAPAFAHPGGHAAVGFGTGFAHPFSGLDHLLAMLAVGLWAVQHQRCARWVLPLAFPLMMVVGAIAGFTAGPLPGVEMAIAGSVAVLGLLIACAVHMPVLPSVALVSLFALAHGYSHGVELPQGASVVTYGIGFVAATALLHLLGVAIGLAASGKKAHQTMRWGGAVIAAAGVYLLATV